MNMQGLIVVSRVLGVIVLISALINLAIAGYCYKRTCDFLNRAISTHGAVIRMDQSSGSNGNLFTPVFEFKDTGGQKHTIVSSVSSSPPSHAVGDTVEVLYEQGNPKDARLRQFFDLWGFTTIFGAIGAFLLLMTLVPLFLVPFAIRRIWPQTPPVSPLQPPTMP